MVSHAETFTIEPSTRLHRQEATAPGPSSLLGPSSRGNLTLHVGGWYQQHQVQKPATTLSNESAALPRVYDYLAQPQQVQCPTTNNNNNNNNTLIATAAGLGGQKRTHALSITTRPSADAEVQSKAVADMTEQQSSHKRLCAGQQQPGPSNGLRITDLLNPAAAAAAAAPALTAAHRMTLPSAMTRSHSADSKHYYQQLAQLQLQLQQQQQQNSAVSADPMARFTRTATAPTETPAQGIVREALELDKVYDIACVIIESIWPNHSNSQSTLLCSLRCFVAETHRQSCLGIDALELCMFYLLRAKSIIQSRQRAVRQKKEEQQQQQHLCQLDQQYLGKHHSLASALLRDQPATPPLSPGGAATHGLISGLSANEDKMSSPLDSASESPITPVDSVRSGQSSYVSMDKQQLLGNSMITPLTPHSKRLIAGSTGSLPNSFRTFVAPNPAAAAATAIAANDDTADKQAAAIAAAVAAAAAYQEQTLPAKAPAAKPKSDVTMCGRRMFVAALMCASKFMYDRSYANKAWNKFTKLPLEQLGDMERGFLNMIEYRLYVDKNTYDKFHRLLARSCMRNGRLMVCDPANNSSPTVSLVGDNSVSGKATGTFATSNAVATPMTPLSPTQVGAGEKPFSFSAAADHQHAAKLQKVSSSAASAKCGGGAPELPAIQIQDKVASALRARKIPRQQPYVSNANSSSSYFGQQRVSGGGGSSGCVSITD
ncbi:PHO85 cyclin-5 [Coemansia sp. BCRC 34301]|nr:PHO85 cyclin-5 [Coemansia sp. BCRC 34301]